MVNSGVDLAQTLVQDPHLKVLVLNGYFDLGTVRDHRVRDGTPADPTGSLIAYPDEIVPRGPFDLWPIRPFFWRPEGDFALEYLDY